VKSIMLNLNFFYKYECLDLGEFDRIRTHCYNFVKLTVNPNKSLCLEEFASCNLLNRGCGYEHDFFMINIHIVES
jgi:hypothetical protein